jgi:butyryl-CoA dehydrogenase
MGWSDNWLYALSDEERLVQESARAFASKELAPIAASLDREHRFPKEIIPKLAENGFLGVTIAAEYGGADLTQLAYALIIEELSAECASSGVIVSAHNSLALYPISSFGNQIQKKKYLPEMVSGKALGCFALSEPGTGSDAAALSCRVTKSGDKYLINGSKNWITNGPVADVCVLFAMQDSSLGNRGITAFVHPMNLPGIERGKAEDKLGIRASPTCSISYNNLELTKEHLLGDELKGFKVAMSTLNGGRIGIAAQAVGIARAALNDALKYSKERKTFGVAIHKHQSITNYLADMVTRLDAARYLTLAAAKLKDEGQPFHRQAAMAKLFASETAVENALKGIQIHGGYGYVTDYPAERHLRDAKITEIYEGTSEIQRLVIGGALIEE